MLVLLVMTVFIAISDIFGSNADTVKIDEISEEKVPIYVAVLYSLLFPIAGSLMTMLIKYQSKYLRLNSTDWV